MVHVQGHRNRDIQIGHKVLNHIRDRPVTAHVLGRAAGDAQNDGGMGFLGRQQKGSDRLHIVQVEMAHCIMSFFGLPKHFLRIY